MPFLSPSHVLGIWWILSYPASLKTIHPLCGNDQILIANDQRQKQRFGMARMVRALPDCDCHWKLVIGHLVQISHEIFVTNLAYDFAAGAGRAGGYCWPIPNPVPG